MKTTYLIILFLISVTIQNTTIFTANAMDMKMDMNMMHRPDSIPPIGVMGSHTHHKGLFMLSYKYMYMSMDGLRDGTDNLGTDDVLEDFPVTPTDMDTQMHMFGIMYAPTDYLTLMGMIPYIKKSMNHVTRMGVKFNTETDGFGDLKVMGLIKFYDKNNHIFHLNAGISFPTGSIDETDDTPAGEDQQLPYPMQLGSGTFDLIPGITYLGNTPNYSWGAQALAVVRLGENDRDYTLGNRFELTSWGAWKWNNWVSTSARLKWISKGNIDGSDPDLNPDIVPTADTNLQAFNRLDGLLGINFYVPEGPTFVKGQRLALEAGLPIYQDLDGPQLEMDWVVTFGLQYFFMIH